MSLTSPWQLRFRGWLLRDNLACHQLGAMHATGEGARRDDALAIRWYFRAAHRGDPESQYDLGFMLLLGEGVAADRTEALLWLERAAAKGHASAAALLHDLEARGDLSA
ncbi:MAG: sel1 repeat family protein [Thermoanaerobaculia bacterium]|nr:sel1 repeat family protein [Thermoanaerobaculia bacterium]MBP9825316.1 sel1 repeat family protein [Thermoanaerobaculia bacterium]